MYTSAQAEQPRCHQCSCRDGAESSEEGKNLKFSSLTSFVWLQTHPSRYRLEPVSFHLCGLPNSLSLSLLFCLYLPHPSPAHLPCSGWCQPPVHVGPHRPVHRLLAARRLLVWVEAWWKRWSLCLPAHICMWGLLLNRYLPWWSHHRLNREPRGMDGFQRRWPTKISLWNAMNPCVDSKIPRTVVCLAKNNYKGNKHCIYY